VVNNTISDNLGLSGKVVQNGSGRLVLTGDNTYTGATTVNAGILSVNGSIADSAVTVNGGTLGGNGTVGTTLVKNGGAIGPGNSIGTLTVRNSLTFGAGSKYLVEVGATSADLTQVVAGPTGPGNAVLTGGTVDVDFLTSGTLLSSYRILTAEGGLGGTKFKGLDAAALRGS
jgi:autotransporter-associated beta strand protein